MAESIKGARVDFVVTDEIAHFAPTHITIDADTGYGFIDSTWGRVELNADDTREAVKRINTAIHEAFEKELIAPIVDTCVHPTRDDSAAAARRAIDAFAAEMRERDPIGARDCAKRGYFTRTAESTIAGKFLAAYSDDAFYTLFKRDGEPWVAIDPARPEFIDTISPLENL